MAQVDLSNFKKLYLKTAKEYLDTLSKNCALLKENFSNREALNKVFIASHSLKSQSQVMNYANIADFSENIERQVRDLLDNNSTLNLESFDIVKNNIDKLNSSLTEVFKKEGKTT